MKSPLPQSSNHEKYQLIMLKQECCFDMLTLAERWTVEELSGVMHVPPGLLRRRLGFWVSQGVLKEESTDTFIVMEKQKGQQRATG